MKKCCSALVVAVLIAMINGCSPQPSTKKAALVKINDYEITKEEFEEAYQNSSFSRSDTPEARSEFLSTLIDQKLILQNAQRDGLDKDKNFLKAVERFWEQSLLKTTLDRRTQQIAGSIVVSDKDVEEVYTKMIKEGKTDKPFQSIYQQIKWEAAQAKESKAMNDWIEALRRQSNITIDQHLLNSK